MVKKLRYYARFIVVCLLLKKMKLVRDLVRELAKHIDDYTATYEPDDQLEWNLVLSEIKSFIEVCENIVPLIFLKSPNYPSIFFENSKLPLYFFENSKLSLEISADSLRHFILF